VGVDYIPGTGPGEWRQDPISLMPLALGAKWAEVRPFVLRSADQFQIPPPPALTSARYTRAFNEVKRLGGDGITTPTERTAEQTIAGIYWAMTERRPSARRRDCTTKSQSSSPTSDAQA
jgi:hypothetical protein